ncbi:MAG: dephospho-CoA kinase [Clostridiales Family XIII bacterium]|jgi:dephospho-CoA kinase|nr:dephospho-CoA kinase [Clostridiales Family XIII bacterium]
MTDIRELKVIGITGGIGSGKSTVSRFLVKNFWTVLDADKIAKEVCSAGKPALKKIQNVFGEKSINIYEELDRRYISRIVFSDKDNLEKLNAIVHQYIFEYIDSRIEIAKQYLRESKQKIKVLEKIFIDAPLLIESGLDKKCNEVWLITADRKKRIERAMSNYGLTKDEVIKRIDVQISDDKKKKYADFIIENNGSILELEEKIKSKLNMP